MTRRRTPRPQPAPTQYAGPESFAQFDAVRTALADLMAGACRVKAQLNAITYQIEMGGNGDERWEQPLEALLQASEDFTQCFRSAGRALGYLDPQRIEEEPET